MSYCAACGATRDTGSQYCTGCGAPLPAAPEDEPDEPDRHPAPAPPAGPAWPDAHPQPPHAHPQPPDGYGAFSQPQPEPYGWPAEQPQSRSRGRFVLILAVVALLAGAAGVTGWVTLTHRSDNAAPGDPTVAAPSLTEAPTSPAETSSSRPAAPSSAVSSEDSALDQLTRQIDLDRPQVQGELAEKWVPQLSSKQLGLVADGMTYRYADILNDHLKLRSTYDARLVWSGDWSSFGKDDFYVTVARAPFGTPDEANAWCDTRGLDPGHCFAKRLSAVAGPEGSTVTR